MNPARRRPGKGPLALGGKTRSARRAVTSRAGVLGRLAVLALAALAFEAAALTCTASATSASFGAYNPFDPLPLDGTGNVRVTCSNLISILVGYTVSMSRGASASYAPRRMSSGANGLNYNLYANAGRSIVWGDGSAGTSTVGESYLLMLLSDQRNYPVYGRIPAGQNVPPGSYTDTIVITVEY